MKKQLEKIQLQKSGTLDLDEWVVEGTIGYRITEELDLLFANRLYVISAGIITMTQQVLKVLTGLMDFLGHVIQKILVKTFIQH